MRSERSEISKRFKLAAIDLDGTLLGLDHQISAANARAVRQLQNGGAQVVLASGRHYNSMEKYAKTLPGVHWIVSCQGGEVADLPRKNILSRAFLPAAQVQTVLEIGHSLGCTSVAYAVNGVLTDAKWNAELDFYTEFSGHRPIELSTSELLKQDVFKVIWMGEEKLLSGVVLPLSQLAVTVQAIRTHARFLEFMPTNISKASGLATLAQKFGIDRSEAVVFGDGENDIPMFDWACTSVAMPHGWPAALRQATHVAPEGPVETAFARGVEMVLTNK